MTNSPLLSSLPYNELEHGWALDVGSYLAARRTALGSLAQTEDEPTRTKLLEHVQLYTCNIQRSLIGHACEVDCSIFDANHFHHMGSTMAAVVIRVQETHSTVHCAFLLLGSAVTFIELGMKSGLRQGCSESAQSVLKQLLVFWDMFSPWTTIEALHTELGGLGGNVDRLRRVLFTSSGRWSSNNSYAFIADIREPTNDIQVEQSEKQHLVRGAL